MVGAMALGYKPVKVSYLARTARDKGRPDNISDIEVTGEKIEDVARYHAYAFPYTKDRTLPLPMKRMGIKGLSYRKYNLTL